MRPARNEPTATYGSPSRRRFLTGAALGGATIVGASALGGLDAEAAFATTARTGPGFSLDPAITSTEFVEGRIGSIQRNVLFVAASDDGRTHRIQITPGTSVWKVTETTIDAAEIGDGLYARGVPMPDGAIAADAVWINIVNLPATIEKVGVNVLQLRHADHELVGRMVPGTTVASTMTGAPSRDLSILHPGRSAQVLGAWRPADDSIDITRIWVGH